uniref:Fatty acid synthase n=1 Tax=Dermatophagoides pteronyssinus TaxID=6956 RepID=A0A6P6XTR2_DERPT|nr:fatty acid synthase-like [Dermatophagoides pteronyssinus]
MMGKNYIDDDIVISGISGRFPESDNIDELKENLYNHVDMVTEDDRRWPVGFYGLPGRNGKLKDLSKLDAQFFGIHGKQARNMDPQARILLELTYEAIVDAGVNPQTLRGTRTGVFIGSSTSEVEEALVEDIERANGYALTGCSRSMFSNRISFTFDFQGPSYTMDTACSSSFMALQQAILALKTNECDQAIVGGTNLCIRPVTSVQFHKLNMLSPEGKCQHLDNSANGYVRSESCSAIFLQRKMVAKRVYATVVHVRTNTDGNKPEGITYPSWHSQMTLMRETVEESGIDPAEVRYVEAHGTGTPVGDPVETKAIAQVFCPEHRKEPLLIGSVKTNLGHAEPASGLNSLAKVLLTFQNKMIPANLHFKSPNTNIPELIEGRIKPVTENTPFEDGIVAVNSFGFGGVNIHVLLKPNVKELDPINSSIVTEIPRLILASGRTEDSVNHIFDFIEKNPDKVNAEFLALLNDVAMTEENSGMNSRGFMIADKHPDGETTFPKEINRVPEKRPIWFVYSGMGSQWTSMAQGLMAIDIFRQSIEKSANILKKFDIDLMNILMSKDEKVLDTIVAPFISIAAVQIALTDLLRALKIEPDGIVGHSVGELGCGYADGTFTHEQMLLSAYWRGRCVEMVNLPKGLMAAVGLTWNEAKARCPSGVVPACHNSQDSVTISGDYDTTKKFVEQLKSENIFAREVKSCNIAFHCHFMEKIAPSLLKKLEEIIPDPKLRSSRWLSSSFSEDLWNEEKAKYSSASYFVHNLQSPVLFHEVVQKIPNNAIVIEIAPHSLLQPIIKRTLGPEIAYLGLMKRNNNDQQQSLFLNALGKLYNLGFNPNISVLYPKIEYPVSRNIQSISSLIKWDHSQSWLVLLYPDYFNPSNKSDHSVKIDLKENSEKFYADHCIDGRILFPATGYLYIAWQMLAKLKGQVCEQTPVVFENVSLHRATILHEETPVKFEIHLMESNGEFTICENNMIVVSGKIQLPEGSPVKLQEILDEKPKVQTIRLAGKEVYKELRLRGYDYGHNFQGIIDADSNEGRLKFSNWVVLADNMLQLGILSKNNRGLYLPVRFQSVRCDPKILYEAVEKSDGVLSVIHDHRINSIIAPGLEIQGLKVNLAPRRINSQIPTLEKCHFTAYNQSGVLDQQIHSKLNEYNNVLAYVTNQLIDKLKISSITKSSVKIDESLLKNYLESSDKYPILSTLQQLSMGQKLEDIIDQIDFTSDPLWMAHESYINVPIHVIIENHMTARLNIAEVNPTKRPLISLVKKSIESSGYPINVDYTILTTDHQDLAEEIEQVTWNPKERLSIASDSTDLIIYKDSHLQSLFNNQSIDYSTMIESMYQSIKDGGFLMAIFRSKPTPAENLLLTMKKLNTLNTDHIDQFKLKAEKFGFELISERSDEMTSNVLLWRKIDHPIPVNGQAIINVSAFDYDKWVEELKTKMVEYQKRNIGENIWLIANDNPSNGVVGLVKCLRQEPGGDRIRCILGTDIKGSELPSFSSFDQAFYSKILKKDLVMNVYRQKQFGSFRHYELDDVTTKMTTEHAYLNVAVRGDLSSLNWYESQHKFWRQLPETLQKSKGDLYTVYYAPLNFRDVMLATGKLPPDALPGDLALQDCILGLEFAGRDQQGKRVMGMVPAKGLATSVLIQDQDFVWPIPDNWTMEQASTVPVVYSTAFYALIVRGELEPGEIVLIHSGSGGVGQAAIAICLSMGCTVFTTVGSNEKREYLKQRFPQLTDRNIANSRDTSFEQHILRQTNGYGVDLVLNSLAEEKLEASVRCVAQHGRFLEIGKYDLSQNNPLGMAAFLKNIAFHGILLDALMDRDSPSPLVEAHRKMVSKLVHDGIATGVVQPLKSNSFEMDKTEQAFRFMATGKHIGKVVIKIRQEENSKTIRPTVQPVMAIARTVLHETKSYIITGGLGGFGLELARWLIERGARKLVLVSRNGVQQQYQHYCLEQFELSGVRVHISQANILTVDGVNQLFKEASSMAPVGGVFHLAMVLSDGFIENQTAESFEKVCAAKVRGTQNLDVISRKVCPDLDYFVTFSSISCGRGNAGQSNYGFANSSMERVCELRRAAGLHGLAIQWGAIGDVGVVSEQMGGNNVVIGGTMPQRIPSCLAVLDRFLQMNDAVYCSHVRAKRNNEKSASSSAGSGQDLLKTISNILGIKQMDNLAPNTSLAELGMDSLMAVEVKQFLERNYEVILSVQELRSLTVKNLMEIGGLNQATDSQAKNSKNTTSSTAMTLSIPVLKLPTEKYIKLNNNGKGLPIFFLPPIEGNFELLKQLAQKCSNPVFGLNWTAELRNFHSIEQASNYFVRLTTEIVDDGSTINIVGYSFGTIIAFDMALQLQSNQTNVSLILLDGSPINMGSFIHLYRERIYNVNNDEHSKETESLIFFLSQLTRIDLDQLRQQLIAMKDKQQQLRKVAEILVEKGLIQSADISDTMVAIETFTLKLMMLAEYKPEQKFVGNITLIRAEESLVKSGEQDEDYGCSKIVTGKCECHKLPGNHQTFITDNVDQISELIQQKLI